MQKPIRKILATLVLGIGAAGVTTAAGAQEAHYPSRPITIVLPFGPGSGTDIVSRLLAQRIGDALGQPVVIDNKPGANGSIAAEYVARAKPDGYTLFMGTNSTHGANPALQKNLRYDPIKGFEPVNRIAIFTSIVVANPQAPFKTMNELIAYGKSNDLTMGTGNASGVVQSETLARQVGWKQLTRVPFRSNPPAMTEVMAGRVQFMFSDIATVQAQVKAGSLRALAVTSKSRSALMPELPTIADSGVPDYDLSGWISLFAPAGTPKPIVERLNAETTRILQIPEVRQRMLDIAAEPSPLKTAEFAAWVQGEVNKWTRLVRESGIQPE